ADVQGRYHFHPEWAGYMGKAYKAPTFHVTAITMRKRSERPFIYPMGVHMYDCNNIDTTVREAAFYELCERIQPGLINDVNIPFPMTDWAGAILQVVQPCPASQRGGQGHPESQSCHGVISQL